MPTLEGADAYFAQTLRNKQWLAFGDARATAISEAASMLSRLSFLSRPPTVSMDNAVYEQAFCLLDMPPEAKERVRNMSLGLRGFSVGKHSESYTDDIGKTLTDGMPICPNALSWIAKYLQVKGVARGGSIRTRGSCRG